MVRQASNLALPCARDCVGASGLQSSTDLRSLASLASLRRKGGGGGVGVENADPRPSPSSVDSYLETRRVE